MNGLRDTKNVKGGKFKGDSGGRITKEFPGKVTHRVSETSSSSYVKWRTGGKV